MTYPVAQLLTDSSFHPLRQGLAENAIKAALQDLTITPIDAAQIREFIAELRSCKNISAGRANKLTFTLIAWRRFIGPYASNTIGDLYAAIPELRTAKSHRQRPFKQNTISDFIAILKQFYLWMIENKYSSLSETKIHKLQTPPKDTMTKVAADLLTPDEITAMVKACTRTMDRALIMMLYEGGFRIGEIGTMTWGDLTFDKYGIIANVNFKTNMPRYVRLIMAREYLAQWRACYKPDPSGERLVFVNERGRPLIHATINKRLKCIATTAGIRKHITPHVFRHSRITHLIKEGVPESVIKLMMWGNISTDMFRTYAHLTGQDIDSAMLQSYGISVTDNDNTTSRLEPVQCPHCRKINPPISNYCFSCGQRLTDVVIDTDEGIQQSVHNNPDILRQLIDERIAEMKRKGEL
jgi:site-specific recombinase XerD